MPDRDVADDKPASEQSERRLTVPGFGPPREGAALPVPVEPTPPRNTVRNVVLVLSGIVLVSIVVVVLIAWLFLSVIRGTVDDVESNRNETAITVQQYRSVELGASEDDVRAELGDPDDESAAGASTEESSGASTKCLYYNEKDAGLMAGDRFKFCFTQDQLVRKSRS